MAQLREGEVTMAQNVVKQIRKATRRRFSAEEKIRIVLEGLRGEIPVTQLCRRGGIQPSKKEARNEVDDGGVRCKHYSKLVNHAERLAPQTVRTEVLRSALRMTHQSWQPSLNFPPAVSVLCGGAGTGEIC
jgi:transposase-like protein